MAMTAAERRKAKLEFDEFCDRLAFERGEWRTRDGSYIKVKSMHTDHILNCCAKIMRGTTWRVYYIPMLVAELDRRGVTFGGNDAQASKNT